MATFITLICIISVLCFLCLVSLVIAVVAWHEVQNLKADFVEMAQEQIPEFVAILKQSLENGACAKLPKASPSKSK